MTVTPDPKPFGPIDDPASLSKANRLFQQVGCGICGVTADHKTAEQGYRVEVHHMKSRGAGGGDEWDNLFPACGALLNGHHDALQRYQISLKRDDAGALTWMDSRPGGPLGWKQTLYDPLTWEGGLRYEGAPPPYGSHAPSDDSAEASDGSESWIATPASEVEAAGPVVASAPLTPTASPEERHQQIKVLLEASEKSRLAACALLLYAYEQQEWIALETTWVDYYGSLNLHRAAVAKMLKVARTFRAAWLELPDTDAARGLTLERLYLGAQLVDRGILEADEAMAEAGLHPYEQLRAKLSGKEPADRCTCTCPECGKEVWHDRAPA